MELTHLDHEGQARMVDVGDKPATMREAVAAGEVLMSPTTLDLVRAGTLAKGDVLAVARVAGIMAAKRTSDLIPLCHTIALTSVEVELRLDDGQSRVLIESRVRCTGPTGVEMEALTAVTVAALTIYDMCKAVERGIRISNIRLRRKSGGRSGDIMLD